MVEQQTLPVPDVPHAQIARVEQQLTVLATQANLFALETRLIKFFSLLAIALAAFIIVALGT